MLFFVFFDSLIRFPYQLVRFFMAVDRRAAGAGMPAAVMTFRQMIDGHEP